MLVRRQGLKGGIFSTIKRNFLCIHLKPEKRQAQSWEFSQQKNEGIDDIEPLTFCRNHHKLSGEMWLYRLVEVGLVQIVSLRDVGNSISLYNRSCYW